MLYPLSPDIVAELQKQSHAWKWCFHCKHKGKSEWKPAVQYCPDCKQVFCKDHLSCACGSDD